MKKSLYEKFIEKISNTPKYYDKANITPWLAYRLDKIEGF